MAIDCVTGHRVFIMDKGGKKRLNEITQLVQVKWGRVRDDISVSQIDLNGRSCTTQAKFLETIEPGRHELKIFRGDDDVWEGPITRCAYTRKGMSIFGSDVLWYAYRTAMHAVYSSAYPNVETVVGRVARIFRAELARKELLDPPINVVDWLVEHHFDGEANTAAVTNAMQYTVWGHMDDLAAKAGMDYTTIGRAVHLWDTSNPIGKTQTVTENDFLGDLTVTSYGSDLVTRAIVTDGQGNFGEAAQNGGDGTDPYYGEVETLFTAYDETTDTGPAPTTDEMASQAQRNLTGMYPTPVRVKVPDNSSLNPRGVLKISDLVPGTYIPMRASLAARSFYQVQKLDSVTVTETPGKEVIAVTMSPATSPDLPDGGA